MTNPPTDLPPAGLELLDPDPAPPARGPHWERLLGLLLVVGIAAAGLWQWVSAGTQHAAYRTAVQAETAQDWDRALAAYGQAGDYSDAPARRTNVTAAIHERDSAYATASRAFAQQDWATLLPALRPLERLAPTYRDTPRFIQARETEVYTPALSGTVALRPTVQPPGLYTYRSGWHWLTGSDTHSQITARCPNGDWVFDVALAPSGGQMPSPAVPTAAPSDNPNITRLVGRRLALVTADGTALTLLDPALNDWDSGGCDTQRVWGYRQDQRPVAGDSVASVALSLTWQLFDHATAQGPSLPGPAWILGYPSPDGQTLLVLDTTHFDARQPRTPMFLANVDGSNLRPLGEFPGLLEYNQFSPDSRSLMLKMQQPLAAGADRAAPTTQIRILWIMLTDPSPPRLVAQITLAGDQPVYSSPLNAFFLTQDPYANWLFVQGSNPTGDTVDLITPDATLPRQTYPLPADLYGGFYPTAGDGTGRLLLPFTSSASNDIRGGTDTIGILNRPTGLTRLQPLLLGKELSYTAIRADRLIYEVRPRYYGAQEPIVEEIYSVPLTRAGQAGVQPTLVYSNTRRLHDSPYTNTYFGQDWLTYVTSDGELHARRYDGSGDVLLDRGVTGFDPNASPKVDQP
ncbi:MAG: hypothetical protein M3Z04_09595 [Chloroflexota bacterium]|nr:hypothetical protein [Chloroflexota bacterium]